METHECTHLADAMQLRSSALDTARRFELSHLLSVVCLRSAWREWFRGGKGRDVRGVHSRDNPDNGALRQKLLLHRALHLLQEA